MKRLLTILTILSVILLAACGLNGGGSTSESSSGKAEDSKSNEGKKVLEFWHIDPGEKEKIYEEAVARFEEKHPDVDVKVLRIPNDAFKQKLSVAMSGNEAPDVFSNWGEAG